MKNRSIAGLFGCLAVWACVASSAVAAETTGTAVFADLDVTQNNKFWNTTGHAAGQPVYAYARLTAEETDLDIAVTSLGTSVDYLTGGASLDARIYYPSVLSSSILFTSFPAGMTLFIR